MNANRWIKIAGLVLLSLALFKPVSSFAQPMLPPDPYVQLCTWSFEDTNWYSDLGYAPVSFTNLNNPPSFDGNALQVDSTNAAWLQYNIVENDGTTNLTFGNYGGTIELWVLPDWNSGTGPSDWGRLIDVGAYSTNNPSSWWSLYFSPDGSSLNFSSETNGVFTNYLSCPISWDTNTWHFIALTYNRFRSELYIDGQLATNGAAMEYLPSTVVLTNGFFVGGDNTGAAQSRSLIDDMATYSYALSAGEVTNDYVAGLQIMNGGGHTMDSGGGGPSLPGGGSGGGGGSYSPSYAPPDYGTNLWIAQWNMATNTATGTASNTIGDVEYEIQGVTDLTQTTNWTSLGFFYGSETTNWTPLNAISVSLTNNLFVRLRSWIDSENVGIPDWWQLLYFGYVGINPNAPDPAGDGYSNLQEYELGQNPNVFTPPAVNNFIAVLSTNGTNVILSWTPSAGAVQHYALGRYDFDWNTYNYDFTSLGQVGSNTVSSIDSSDTNVINGDIYDTYYQIQAVYTNGTTPATYAWWIQSSPPAPQGLTVTYNSGTGAATVNWQTSPGAVTGYTVLRQNSPTSGFSPIATVSSSLTSYTDNSYPGGNGVEYEVEADYAEGDTAPSDSENPRITPNYTVPAYIVRGPNGLPYLTVAGIPQNVTTFRIYRVATGAAYYPISSYLPQELLSSGVGSGYFDVPATNLANGAVYQLNSTQAPPYGTYQFLIQALGADGLAGDIITNGYVTGDTNRADYNIPFHDGRAQIAQNVNFLLRETQTNSPFKIGSGSSGAPGYSFSADSSYVSAGFHLFNDNNSSPLTLNEFQPFEENNYYKNYCYSGANVDTNGYLNTGIGDNIAWGLPWYWAYFTDSTPTYNFDTYGYVSGASSPSFATVLDSTTTQWQLLANNSSFVSLIFGYTYYIPTAKNVYGLSLISIKWPGWTTPPTFPTASPGTTLTNTSGAWFFQFDQPTLNSNSYYFARHYIDPLPGESGFSVTNTTPVIFTSVGQPFNITAWAKQSLANGFSGKFAFAEQYFDKANLADNSGNITTNQTGILSEYGEFFPTQPGTAILTTKADGALGTVGQCKVNVIGLNVDANHDGAMDLTFGGKDQTLPSKPYVFWCNNNFDRLHKVDGSDLEQDDVLQGMRDSHNLDPNDSDCNYTVGGNRVIPCVRDLEDFSRLWVSGFNSNVLASLPSGSTVTLTWGNVSDGNPTIDLFTAADTNGGTGYLTNSTIAAQQTNSAQCPYVGRLAPGGSLQLNASQFTNNWAGSYFIWCGVDNGSGQLTLSIADANGNPLGQASVYIQIKDIKQMYERWTVGDVGNAPPVNVAANPIDGLPIGTPAFQYTTPVPTNTPYILFVHGWNMQIWEKDRFAETAFKRLYWQGYQGRFGEFRWPTFNSFPFGEFSSQAVNLRNFDDSESNAWASSVGLLNKLTSLNAQYPSQVYLIAHSMGNIVAGEALRLAGSSQVVNSYIAMQGAVSAHAYDQNTATRSYSFSTPDDYASYWTNGVPYFSGSAGAGTYVNLFNTNDYALHSSTFSWEFDQDTKPDDSITGYPGYHYNVSSLHPNGFYAQYGSGTNAYQNFNFPGDTYTIFAYCDQARSYALGAQVGVAGVFATSKEINLSQSPYNFDQTHKSHSGEFRSDNAQRWQFWNTVLIQMRLNN